MTNLSLVHNKETSDKTPNLVSYQDCLKSRCRPEWLAANQLYRFLDVDEKRERSWNLNNCRTSAWFIRNIESGKVSIASSSCGLRWCPLCAQARSNFIRHSVSEWLTKAKHPKFLTMTLKHSAEPLADQVNRLYSSFRKLRKIKNFKKLVSGGVWFFQLCRNEKRGEWHPHLHCIVTGDYIPYKMLRTMWLKITGDSDVVDIRIVQNPKKVADYVARYAARPAELSTMSIKLAKELYSAMHGKRLCGKWGLFTKVDLSVKRNPDMKGWEKIGSWYVVTQHYKTVESARQIIEAFETQQPLASGVSMLDIDDLLEKGLFGEKATVTFDLPPPEKLLF